MKCYGMQRGFVGLVRLAIPVPSHHIPEAGAKSKVTDNLVNNVGVVVTALTFVGLPVALRSFSIECSFRSAGLFSQRRLEDGLKAVHWKRFVFSEPSCRILRVFLFTPIPFYGASFRRNGLLYPLKADRSEAVQKNGGPLKKPQLQSLKRSAKWTRRL